MKFDALNIVSKRSSFSRNIVSYIISSNSFQRYKRNEIFLTYHKSDAPLHMRSPSREAHSLNIFLHSSNVATHSFDKTLKWRTSVWYRNIGSIDLKPIKINIMIGDSSENFINNINFEINHCIHKDVLLINSLWGYSMVVGNSYTYWI